MKLLAINGGVKLSDDSDDYIFDYRYNHPEDIIHIYNKKVYISRFKGSVYYFGYEFNEDTSSKQRSDFIHYIKGIGDNKISDHQLQQFIEYPLDDLDRKINMYSIDCFVYPISGRSKLVQKMIDVINGYSSRSSHKVSYEMIKSAPTDLNMNEEDVIKFEKLKGDRILIVDDINTSSSTLNEILRVLKTINNNCEIYIYTLIGNFNS